MKDNLIKIELVARRKELFYYSSGESCLNLMTKDRKKELLDNILILHQFVFDFVTVFKHKGRFESTIEGLYDLYAQSLDEYYDQVKVSTI